MITDHVRRAAEKRAKELKNKNGVVGVMAGHMTRGNRKTGQEAVVVLVKKKLPLSAGPLLCFSEEYIPKWLLNSNESFERIMETAYQFVLDCWLEFVRVVDAYRRNQCYLGQRLCNPLHAPTRSARTGPNASD